MFHNFFIQNRVLQNYNLLKIKYLNILLNE